MNTVILKQNLPQKLEVAASLIAIFLCLLLAPPTSQAKEGDYLGGPPPGEKPLEVRIGFNLVNLTDVSEKDETIDFEGAIYLNWKDPRLAYDPAEVGLTDYTPGDYSQAPRRIYQGDFRVKEIFNGWRLHVVIPNGVGDRIKTNMGISIWPDGMVEYSETFYVKVETPMNLRRFPFDSQELEIFFHPFIYMRDEVVLIPDDGLARTWNQNMGIAQWSRGPVLMAERPVEMAYFDESKENISEFVVTVHIDRLPLHVLTSIIFPMIVLVSLTWSVFWMDNESVSNRINITFIGILSVVAYYLVVQESIPKINYLTLIDGFIIATFLMLAAGVVLTVVMERLEQSGQKEIGLKVDRTCRWAFPLGYASISFIVYLLFFLLE